MKPRYEEMSYEATVMLEKAKQMNDRINRIEKKQKKIVLPVKMVS